VSETPETPEIRTNTKPRNKAPTPNERQQGRKEQNAPPVEWYKAMTNDELNERWRDAVASMVLDASMSMSRDEFWSWHDAKMVRLTDDGVRDEFMEVTELVVTNTYWSI